MNKSSDKNSNTLLNIVALVIFFFFIPAIGAVLGTTAEIYNDGLRELPPFGIQAIIIAILMIVVSFLFCHFTKADKYFIRIPAILTLIGAVLLPLASSFQKVMVISDTDVTTRKNVAGMVTESLESLQNGIMFIAPALLCAVSSIILAVQMIIILRKRYHL